MDNFTLFNLCALFIYLGLCALVGWYGYEKTGRFWSHFWFSVFLSPVIGVAGVWVEM